MYWIAPYDEEPFEVYCDMTTEGGGSDTILLPLTQLSGKGTAPYSLEVYIVMEVHLVMVSFR